MQLIHIQQPGFAEFQPAEFAGRRAGAGMVPRPDDQVVLRAGFCAAIAHGIAIVFHRPLLVIVIMPGDGQNGYIDPPVVFRRQHHRLPVAIRDWVLQPGLEMRIQVAHHVIQVFERGMLRVHLVELFDPETLLTEQVGVARNAAGQSQPLHFIGIENILKKREIHRGISRRHRHDRFQMRREFFERHPLVKTTV